MSRAGQQPLDLESAARAAVEAALGAGAADAEAYSQDSRQREIRVHGGQAESVTEATERGIGIRTWIDGRSGYAFGTDFGALEELGAAAAEAARISDPDEFAAPPAAGAAPPNIAGLHDPALGRLTTAEAVDLALRVEAAAIAQDSRVGSVEQAVYADSRDRVALVSSTGAGGGYEVGSCYAYASALAQDGAEVQTGLGFGVGRSPGQLDAVAIGEEAGARAADQLGAVKPGSRSCPVVLDPTVAASFISYLGGVLGADAVQRGRSPLADRLGDSIAAECLELVDDGLDPEGLASAPFDDEGTPRRRTDLIAGGVLRAYLHDAYTARRGGGPPTGNASRAGYRSAPSVAASNLVVRAGAEARDDLIARAGEGVYVNEVAGLHSGVNPISGVFSVGAGGRLIEGGELAGPLREFTIASDLITMLSAIDSVAAEARWVPFGGSVKTPALLISEMTISGS